MQAERCWDSGSSTPTRGRLPCGCAMVMGSTASRPRVHVTNHPTALYYMVVSVCGGHTCLLPPIEAERCASAAAGSGSEARADAGGSRLQAIVSRHSTVATRKNLVASSTSPEAKSGHTDC